jgi:Spy/CpxP family protein refolding chaperone
MRLLVIIAMAIGLLSTSAEAQRSRGDAPIDKREKVKQKIRALRAYTLTETLSLDEKTAGKLFPVLAKWDDVTDKLMVQRIDLQRQLEAIDSADGKAIDKLIDEAMANARALLDLEEKRLAELRKILTPAQTAKLLVVLPRFERRIRNQLSRAIENRGGGNPRDGRFRGRRGGGFTEDSDELDDIDDDAPAPRTRLPERTAPMRDTPRAPDQRRDRPCDPFNDARGCR